MHGQTHNISGYVEDINTGERVIGAYIADSISKSITHTNSYGFFNLKIIGKNAAIQAIYMGLKSEILYLHPIHDTLINIQMRPVKELQEVIITYSIYKHNLNDPLGLTIIPVKKLTSIPALGESDLVKSIQSQPGIKGGVEGSSSIFVRGGGPGENLFMLDDVPMYNVSHLYGFLSTFNSSAIKDIKLFKGPFPARYGGRTSSVIDIRSLDGNNRSVKGELSIGFISSKFTIEGPLLSPKTTFIISGRRSYFDLFSSALKAINLIDLNFPGYHFYDMNIRISHTFSEKDKIFLSFYSGKDKILYKNKNSLAISNSEIFSESTDETSGWGNVIGSLRWNHTIARKLFVNSTFAISSYNYYILSNYKSTRKVSIYNESFDEAYSAGYRSNIFDLIIKTDFDFLISKNHKLLFGVGNTIHTYNPGSNIYNMKSIQLNINIDTSFTNTLLKNSEPYFYCEDEMKLTKKLLLASGLRLSGSFQGKNIRINVEPRLSVNYSISSHFVVKAGYSRMVQYLHLLSTSGLSMPTDIWIPALKGLQPLKSDQINAGFSYFQENVPMISIEVYRKWLRNTTDLRNGSSLLSDLSPWYEKTTQGRGNAEGVEVSIEKQEGRLNGSINYTYAIADRNYHELNNGKTFPFKYDRRHDLNISLNYQISKKWDISALWWFGTGYPVTIPVEKYQPLINIVSTIQHNLVYYYPTLNNYRLPAYHRLDIAVHFKIHKKNIEHAISFDIFNIYNHKNPIYMYYLQNYSFEYVYLFPIIPSVTYSMKF